MIKRVIFIVAALSTAFSLQAANHIFEDAFNAIPDKAEVFKTGGDWFQYPAYSDREAWQKLSEPFLPQILKNAEKYLDYQWELYKATDYLKYEKTGDRKLSMAEEHNRMAIIGLTLGELAEGKGRFMPQLIDGLYFLSSQYSWAHSQHTAYQSTHRTLPTPDEQVISLHGVNTGACIAVAWHFFHEEFDKLDPSLSKTIAASVDKQVLTPFLDEKLDTTVHKIWIGFNRKPEKRMNNWTPYCDHNTILCFLLMENDRERLLKAIERSVKIMDIYMGDQSPDGACDEGPGYWNMAFGKVYDYARTLSDASGGRLDVFSDELIRKMGEYKSKMYLSGGWPYSFGDCSTRDSGTPAVMFRFGKDCGSAELMNYALYQLRDKKTKAFKVPALNFGQLDGTMRQLEALRYQPALEQYGEEFLAKKKKGFESLRHGVGSVYYPDAGYAVVRKGKWILAVKGAHNGESHNHNDVGSSMVLFDTMPIILDPGVGTYTKDTFGDNRYTVWTMRSDWHSTPSPNGALQINGRERCAKNTSCDLDTGVFSTDVASAYPEDAAVRKWVRSYALSENGLTVSDTYELSKRTAPDILNFPIRGDVALPGETAGERKAGKDEVIVRIRTYEGGRGDYIRITWSKGLKPSKEVKEITDKKIAKGTGPEFTRLFFTSAPKAPKSGSYTVTFSRLAAE